MSTSRRSPERWTPPVGSRASSLGNLRSMRANRGRDTSPELALRSLLWASGIRGYRVSKPPMRGFRRTADLVFGPSRVAVFVDGCYWHRCPLHYTAPKTNAAEWRKKVERTVERDRETDAKLTEAGWLVLRFWEHEAPEACAPIVRDAVESRRPRRSR